MRALAGFVAFLLAAGMALAAQSAGPRERIDELFQSSFDRIGEGDWD